MGRRRKPETKEEAMERRSLAILVRAIRGALGWSQGDLARLLGLSTTSVAKLESSTLKLSRAKHEELLILLEQTSVDFSYGPGRITITLNSSVISKIDPVNGKGFPSNHNGMSDDIDGSGEPDGEMSMQAF